MNKINTVSWLEFKIKDIFSTIPDKSKLQVPTGASVGKKDLKEGTEPRITVSGINNGITGYYSSDSNDYRLHENFISVSFLSTVFYHPYKASLDMKVHCLKPRNIELNKYTGLFLVTAIRKSLQNYSYADQISSTLLPELTIKLPATVSGEPDFSYMEQYMKNLETTVCSTLTELQSAPNLNEKSIDTTNWKDFIIMNLFEIKHPNARSQSKYEKGEIPYISSSSYNNGVVDYLLPKNDEILDRGNCITVSPLDGSSYYQENDFLGRGGSGASISMLYNKNLNKYNALFICAVIKAVATKFGYNDLLNSDNLKSLKIKLPAISSLEPDWDYMEQYMKNLLIHTNQNIETLTCAIK